MARAAGRPQVQASSSQGYALLKDAGGGGTRYTTRNALELRQPVHTGGALEAGVRRADRLVVAERARLARAEQDALLAAVEAYGRLGLARAGLDLARGHEARAATELDAARQRFRLGDATTTDVARAEARRAGAAADRELAAGELEEAGLDYGRAVGEPPSGEVGPLPECALAPPTLEDAESLAAQHPSLRAAEAEVDRAEAEVDAAASALRPKLALVGRLAYVDQPESELSRRGEASVGAVVSWPLYAGGGDRARVRQARQGVAQRRQEALGERLDLARDARAAWRARATARARVESVRGQARAAGIALEGARAEAILGARTVVEVLDAEEDLYEAELALERARHEALLAGWILAAAAGELTAAGLGLPSEPE